MSIYLSIYLTSLGILVIVITGIAIRAFLKQPQAGAGTFGFLMLSMAIWAGCYFLEIVLPEIPEKILARKFLYVGMSLAPPLWLAFALQYTDLSKWWAKESRALILTLPAIAAIIMGITNEKHLLIWKTLITTENLISPLHIEYGPVFWFFTVTSYLLIISGVIVYGIQYVRSDHAFRVKTGIMLIGAAIIGLFNLFFLLLGKSANLDPTPLSFGVSAPLFALGFFRFGVNKVLPLAAPLVIENLEDAIILTDSNDLITDMNRRAKRLFWKVSDPEGVSAFSLLPEPERFKAIWNDPHSALKIEVLQEKQMLWFTTRVIPLEKGNHELLGRVIIFTDISSEQNLLKAEQRRSKQLALLEESGRFIADSLNEHDIFQKAVDSIVHQFGYALTCISILTPDNMLEIRVINGTYDFGYETGYQQKLGSGIIGHTAVIQKTYLSHRVAEDPYYYSTAAHFGSAICTPIWKQGSFYGVLYIESLEPDTFDDLDITTLETLATQISGSLDRASLLAQSQENLRTLATIQYISKSVAGSLDLEIIGKAVVNSLKNMLGYTHVSIYLLEEDYLHLLAEVDYPDNMIIQKIHISQGVTGRAVRTKSIQFIKDTTKENVFLKADLKISSEICVPLVKEDTVLGVLNVEASEPGQLSQTDVELLTTIASPIAISVDNARLHGQIKKMAITDAVTGLFNRHIFEQTLSAEIERAQRNNQETSLIIFDIDSFKQYNDSWGHPAGDARLKAVGDIIQRNLRKYDIAARYGGDEFAVILSDCNTHQALSFARRLLEATRYGAPTPAEDGESIPGYTLSMGIASYPKNANTPGELLIAADLAAMLAKQNGKNQIRISDNYEAS